MTQWALERTDDQTSYNRIVAAAAGAITYATAVGLAVTARLPLCDPGHISTATHTCHTVPTPLLVVAPFPLWMLLTSMLIALKGVQRRLPTIEILELEIGLLNSREAPWPRHPSSRTDSARTLYESRVTQLVQLLMYGGMVVVITLATAASSYLLFEETTSTAWRALAVVADTLMASAVILFALRRPKNRHSEVLAQLRTAQRPEH